MEKRSTKLVETMTLFIKIQAQSCQHGMLSIKPMVEQVSDPFLKTGLQMCVDGYDSETIKTNLKAEVDSTDAYRNLVIEGIVMVANQYAANPTVMLEEFKSHLSAEDQTKLDVMAGKVVEDWEEMCVSSAWMEYVYQYLPIFTSNTLSESYQGFFKIHLLWTLG